MVVLPTHHTNRHTNQRYNKALYIVQNLPASSSIQPTKEQKLQLYALYKQASQGDVDTQRPGLFDIVGRAKWDAWKKLQGMSEMEAKDCYVEALLDVAKEALKSPIGRTQAQQIIQSFSTIPSSSEDEEDDDDNDNDSTDTEEMAYLEQVQKSQPYHHFQRSSSSRASSQTVPRRMSQSSTSVYRRPVSASGSIRSGRFAEEDASLNPWELQPSSRYLSFVNDSVYEQSTKRALSQLQQQLNALSDRIDSLKRELMDRQVNRVQKKTVSSDEDGWRWVFKAAVKHAVMNLMTVSMLLLVLYKNQSPVAQAILGLIQSFWQRLKS